MENKGEGAPHHGAGTVLLKPVVLIPLILLGGIYISLAVAIFGYDKGVISKMATQEFARGMITYLFALVTIGTAVVLVVYSLSSDDGEVVEKKFQRGKEILALLLGVFGTIVGFYFGSATREGLSTVETLRLTPVMLNPSRTVGGQSVTLVAAVSGGVTPYRYKLQLGSNAIVDNQLVKEDGWIVQEIKAPAASQMALEKVTLQIIDGDNRAISSSAQLEILPEEK